MDKRLIRCNDCKHTFFTEKVDLSDGQIKSRKLTLMAELKDLSDEQTKTAIKIQTLQDRLKEVKHDIIEVNKDIDILNYTCQCSECGNRFHALPNEVNI